jgi:competence protein ComEA
MDLIGEERGRLARAASWLEATPAEVVGLAILLVSAVAVTGVLVWSALGRPALAAADVTATPETGPEAADVGVAADAGLDDEGGEGTGPEVAAHDEAAAVDEPEPTDEVTVHVAGAVAQPGVVTLPGGSRVTDAVAAAGGLLPDADPSRVNLARQLQDGEQLVILRAGEEPPPPTPGDAAAASDGTASDGPVDLNTASVEQLQTLPGIGPALAQRIVRHRDEVGPFRAPGDLRDVSGIGEKRFQDLADLITVG